MRTKLEKIKQLPYYVQLKNILKERISSGKITSQKLPPVRTLAKDFGVSVNTVLRAYDELRKEGIVNGAVGRGTFITVSPQVFDKENKQVFLSKIIGIAVEEALSHEIPLDEFEEAVKEYVKEKTELLQNVKLVFIECNIEQLTYFVNHLELDPHIKLLPVLLEDIYKKDDVLMNEIKESDIIVTSFYHLNDVHKYLDSIDKPIIGINLEPEVRTIVEVAKIPEESTVGIVTTSKTFIEIIKEILRDLRINFKKIIETNASSDDTIRETVMQCGAVLVSPRRKKTVESFARKDTKIIEFVFTPDRTSINNLKVALLDIKKGHI